MLLLFHQLFLKRSFQVTRTNKTTNAIYVPKPYNYSHDAQAHPLNSFVSVSERARASVCVRPHSLSYLLGDDGMFNGDSDVFLMPRAV